MKKILLSLSLIVVVGVVVASATGAFFSDLETSSGNTFTAGSIDLKIDSTATYNGQPVIDSTWQLKDLDPTSDKFFNLSDIKPGDSGENTISMHIINNDAWLCVEVSNLTNFENGVNAPEALVDFSTGTNDGELQNTMVWNVWRDDGSGGGVAGDNIQNGSEQTLVSGHPVNGTLAVYDSTTGTGALPAGTTAYLGVSWSLPASSGNETQTDSLTGDISFDVVQSRNNNNFTCGTLVTDNFDDGNADGWLAASPSASYGVGNWRVEGQQVTQDLGGDHFKFLLNNYSLSSQSVETKALFFGPAGYGGITLWYQNFDNWVDVFLYPAAGTSSLRVIERIGGIENTYVYPFLSSEMTWYTLRVDASSITGELGIYVNDIFVLTHSVNTPNRMGLSGLNSGNSGGFFDDFRISF